MLCGGLLLRDLISLNGIARFGRGINCWNWNRRSINSLISLTDASAFPAVESSCWVCIGSFAYRKVSTNSEALSPSACLAVFFSVFWSSMKVSLLGS